MSRFAQLANPMHYFTRTLMCALACVTCTPASRADVPFTDAQLTPQAALIHMKAVDYCGKGAADDRVACENDFITMASQILATQPGIAPPGARAADHAAAVADAARRRLPAAERLASLAPADSPDPGRDPAAQMIGLSRACEKLFPETAAQANAQRLAALEAQSPEIHREAVALEADRSVAARRRIHAAEAQFGWDGQLAKLVCTLS
ncbi:hypothetical protein Bsp3421_003235 [Burkholderia sp. FERM BP-3421]|uniref:hypothetical protein n=1 Tax=Burkholderia sp. FERM BP-3421 TaxID=1494466 RepID=UPI0023601AFA|nr:hypothetical protein [Burkholderia sp. FERM BP-3421]WDD93174.1 hypothetical protein Bsp3421_003235 [Burkholderia sp. FERM BP-3421]